jgi:hypothetical protein
MLEPKARSGLVIVNQGFEQVSQRKEVGLGYCNAIQVIGHEVGPQEENNRPSIRKAQS